MTYSREWLKAHKTNRGSELSASIAVCPFARALNSKHVEFVS